MSDRLLLENVLPTSSFFLDLSGSESLNQAKYHKRSAEKRIPFNLSLRIYFKLTQMTYLKLYQMTHHKLNQMTYLKLNQMTFFWMN